ncbi:aclacinomycin oxidase [Actinoalloteichus hoggarensis]|uniref:Putative FAD-linked oxidoreductase YvdP n=1 Tax=Actinoalloteichus hoggarensis TaxID=1470176 RepID=A0A221W5C3_9PSEU|nr:FAD-binding protein [Actinoalloteichus hoggarensis]ASO20933.1 putative FAD-linked oxidoreductase YvdP [Actinoalloteichus hoggarensis]MBB5920863.1 aclacinomycin oxidase [Actinoalloteichus hoggarensis]
MSENGAVIVTPQDPRYARLAECYNHRFVGRPDEIRLVATTAQVVDALAEAVATGRRPAVRSGGHCFEDFTAAGDVRMLLDLSPMAAVRHDPERRAFMIEAGATLGQVYQVLHDGWGVTIPAGTCFEVGVGGHITGGGYGHLSRRDGLVVDHLYAIEIVVVDAAGRPEVIVATRDPEDPHRALWWAHTGGGGGNFGVVTRFWLRSPGVESDDPADLLPRAPRAVRRRFVQWSWDTMTEERFARLVDGYCSWLAAHSAPDSPYRHLWSNLIITHRSSETFGITSVIDADVPEAARLLSDHLASMTEAVDVDPVVDTEDVAAWMSEWMPSYSWPSDPRGRYKHKAAYLRRPYSRGQLTAIYDALTDPEYHNPAACLVLTAFGGRVNSVARDATAIPQRDSILKASYSAGAWFDAAEDDVHIAWVRRYYRSVYAESGGVPVPDDRSDGSYISYPDADLADPEWNTSGVPWHVLYYKDNYHRLARVKARYDPRDVFRHALSVRPASD